MSNIFPPAPTLLKRVRFELASAHFPDGRVPLDRVAMIGCYLMQWCSRNIGGWEHTPPLDIAGDTYIGFSAQEKIKLLNDSKTSDKTCRFTSLENVYGLADDEEDDDDDDADNEGVPVGSPRGKRKELHATLEATADNDANDTSSGNVSEAESAKAPLVTEATRRQQQAMERAKLRHAQDLKSAAQTVDAGAKILSVRRDIMADTEALATTMHNAEMEIGDAPNVTIVADDAADETAE